MPAPLLSIVIVNYHTRDLTLALVESIYATAFGRACEVLVLDNASGDGCLAALAARFPAVRGIQNATNTYFSPAYTQGLQAARGDYLLALNPDMLVRGDALAQLLAALRADPALGAVTTQLYFADGTLQRNGMAFPRFRDLLLGATPLRRLARTNPLARTGPLWYPAWDRTTPRDLDMLPGSCILASAATWRAAGYFEPRLLMYYSDDLFCRRLAARGLRRRYVLTDGLVHLESQSTRQAGGTPSASAALARIAQADLHRFTRLAFGPAAAAVMAVALAPARAKHQIRSTKSETNPKSQ